jgi:hypothetical protein
MNTKSSEIVEANVKATIETKTVDGYCFEVVRTRIPGVSPRFVDFKMAKVYVSRHFPGDSILLCSAYSANFDDTIDNIIAHSGFVNVVNS